MSAAPPTIGSPSVSLPALFTPTPDAGRRFVEFFTANIRNPNTRRACARTATRFAHWCEMKAQLRELTDIEPVRIAAYVEIARVGAALKMRVEDVYVQGRRTWVRLHEKGGKRHEMPCHHNLETYLHAYIDAAGLAADPKGLLFRTTTGRTGVLTANGMTQADAYRMSRRRAAQAGIATRIGNHSFRATGITEYLKNGGKLEIAQRMANHESARTTGLYDRRDDQVSLDEVERIVI